MREFETTIADLSSGLRAFKINKSGLLDCFNAIPGGPDEGLSPHEEVGKIEPYTPACGNWVVSWPWPRVMFGSFYTLGFAIADSQDCGVGVPNFDDQIVFYEMSYTTHWVIDPIWYLGFRTEISQIDMIDFGLFYAISVFGYNAGVPVINSLYRIPDAEKPSLQIQMSENGDFPNFISGCNFNGQAVIGGISSDLTIWADRGLNSVCWSGIGNFNFNPTDNLTAGFVDMDWQGIIFKVRKLGNQVVVFGDGGITALHPVSDPVSTYGKKNLPLPGVRSGNHVAGDDSLVGWIDENDDFWMMDQGLKNKKLGYREWIQMLGDDVIVSFVPGKKRFFISDGVICFVLSEAGMYSCHQMVTSVGMFNNELIGFLRDTGNVEWRIETNEIDFKQRALKTLQVIELHGLSDQVKVKVKFKSSLFAKNFNELGWKTVNPNGILTAIVSGTDFKICIKGVDYHLSSQLIQNIKLRVKMTDKRSIRGLYNANQNIA